VIDNAFDTIANSAGVNCDRTRSKCGHVGLFAALYLRST